MFKNEKKNIERFLLMFTFATFISLDNSFKVYLGVKFFVFTFT